MGLSESNPNTFNFGVENEKSKSFREIKVKEDEICNFCSFGLLVLNLVKKQKLFKNSSSRFSILQKWLSFIPWEFTIQTVNWQIWTYSPRLRAGTLQWESSLSS